MEELPKNVIIRPAIRKDCPEIYQLINELAVYEKMPDAVKISQETLERDGFDTTPPRWKAFVAEVQDKDGSHHVVGLASYFIAYHTFSGYRFFLEQLYVTEKYKKQNIETLLFQNIVKAGIDLGCSKMDWFVLAWNPARKFYEKLGAINLTDAEDWHVYRLEKDKMLELCSK